TALGRLRIGDKGPGCHRPSRTRISIANVAAKPVWGRRGLVAAHQRECAEHQWNGETPFFNQTRNKGDNMQPSSINVSNLIDTRDLSGYNVKIMAWCFFIMLFDGFDLGVLSFAAPSILREWAVTNPAAMGSVFSASIMGILVGSLMFGYIGDRFGRRNAIIVALTTVGLSSLAVTIVDTLTHLFWLRFITGLGLGGLFPNVAALGAEFAPKKYRATLLILGLMGVTFGVAVPGILATHMVPVHGWQSLFFVGGIGPLLMAVACFIGLP